MIRSSAAARALLLPRGLCSNLTAVCPRFPNIRRRAQRCAGRPVTRHAQRREHEGGGGRGRAILKAFRSREQRAWQPQPGGTEPLIEQQEWALCGWVRCHCWWPRAAAGPTAAGVGSVVQQGDTHRCALPTKSKRRPNFLLTTTTTTTTMLFAPPARAQQKGSGVLAACVVVVRRGGAAAAARGAGRRPPGGNNQRLVVDSGWRWARAGGGQGAEPGGAGGPGEPATPPLSSSGRGPLNHRCCCSPPRCGSFVWSSPPAPTFLTTTSSTSSPALGAELRAAKQRRRTIPP